MVLNLWIMTPGGWGAKLPFHIGGISDIYAIIHNSSKISHEGAVKIILWLGGSPQHKEMH